MEKRKHSSEPLLESSQFVKGVGPQRQVLLGRLGIETIEDLISHFPRRYYDRGDLVSIAKVTAGRQATFMGTVLASSLRRLAGGRSILTVALGDETGTVNLVFFNQPYLEKQFGQGTRILASGEAILYRGARQLVSPEFEVVSGELNETLLGTGRIVPVYPLTSGISQRMMRRIIRSALDKYAGQIRENLPAGLRKELDFPGREEAYRCIHQPDDWNALGRARRRFKFEEVFFLHLLIKERRHNLVQSKKRPRIGPPHGLLEAFLGALPFALTSAQERALDDVRRDVESPGGLNRLLQGDVGSGKTVVGLAAMMMAVGNGLQAALMVPTEILAQQHYARTLRYVDGLPVKVELLIGSMSRIDKERIHRGLEEGSIDLVVGTHALIQESISYRQLGLAVIDEQHRFGVRQRAKLGRGDILPHYLVMTATPIPRSLTQIVYGDLDISLIDELPAGARNVLTEIVPRDEMDRVYEALREAFSHGRQVFMLYPLVEESERSDLLAATQEFERLQGEQFPGFPLGLLHGKMSFEEKSKAIEMFRRGEILGLVTTTVIEVGVDVPNASILVINNPERFGLAQLHQLRGRVGRGGAAGVCIVVVEDRTATGSMSRLALFARTDDGFRIAEEDLRERGPGEIWGIRQSGYPSFRLIDPLGDNELVQKSWRESDRIIGEDPALSRSDNRVVADYFRVYYRQKIELAEIG